MHVFSVFSRELWVTLSILSMAEASLSESLKTAIARHRESVADESVTDYFFGMRADDQTRHRKLCVRLGFYPAQLVAYNITAAGTVELVGFASASIINGPDGVSVLSNARAVMGDEAEHYFVWSDMFDVAFDLDPGRGFERYNDELDFLLWFQRGLNIPALQGAVFTRQHDHERCLRSAASPIDYECFCYHYSGGGPLRVSPGRLLTATRGYVEHRFPTAREASGAPVVLLSPHVTEGILGIHTLEQRLQLLEGHILPTVRKDNA